MKNFEINKLEKISKENVKLKEKLLAHVEKISNEIEFNDFLENEIMPIVKKYDIKLTKEELLNLEKEKLKELEYENLLQVNGGVSLKSLLMSGGIISLMTIGAGIISNTNSTSATLTNSSVVSSKETLTDKLKIGESDKDKSEQAEKLLDFTHKEPNKTKAEETDFIVKSEEAKKGGSGKVENREQKKKEQSDLTSEGSTSTENEISVLPFKSSTQEEITSTDSDDQKTEIKTVPKTLKDLEIAKSEININQVKENIQLTDEQKLYALKALNLQDAYSLLESGVIENLRFCGNISNIELNIDGTRNYIDDKGDAFTEILTMLFPSSAGNLNTSGGAARYINFSKQTSEKEEKLQLIAKFCAILNDYRNNKCNITFTKEMPKFINDKGIPVQGDASKVVSFLEKYQIIKGKQDKKGRTIYNNLKQEKMQFYISFIKALKQAIDLEKKAETQYPDYLAEHILMSYMIKELDDQKDIENLYKAIVLALSKNESSKIGQANDKKKEIEKENERLDNLNEVINEIKIQELSPYKNATASNDSAYLISEVKDGQVTFFKETFSDCADITVRHIINLVTYSKDRNWDLLLPKSKEELNKLNDKLKEVIDAINKHESANFYNLKTRVQMFFLYQRGLQKDEKYSSYSGADDVDILARTLWEYVICNMNNENDNDFYKILYANSKENIELKCGNTNMLKLMWNIARAVNGQSDEVKKAKIAINKFHAEKNNENLEEALMAIFKLFNSDFLEAEINIDQQDYEDDYGKVNVSIEKEDCKLTFDINQESGHAYVEHNPKELQWDDKFLDKAYTGDVFSLLLLKNFADEYKTQRIPLVSGFYGLFSNKEIYFKDSIKKTEFYKKYNALKTFRDLQDEENNINRIESLITLDLLKGADLISVKDGKNNFTLCDIYYEKYLKSFDNISHIYEVIKKRIDGAKLVDGNDLPDSFIFTDLGNKKARLVIDSDKFNEEKLNIPNEIKNKKGEIFQIEKIAKLGEKNLSTLKTAIISKNVTRIGNRFFCRCKNLESVTFEVGSKLKEIGKQTFSASQITKLVIPKCVTIIEDGCFNMCSNLETIEFEPGSELEKFGVESFKDSTITKIKIPKSVKTIEEDCFYECKNLESVTFEAGSKLQKLGDYAFSGSLITKVTIPKSVTTIGACCFYECKSLESVTFEEESELQKIGRSAFNDSQITKLVIPKNVTIIENMGFCRCYDLNSITFEAGSKLQKIGDFAFNCSPITKIKIPKSVTTIGDECFKGCDELELVIFEEGSEFQKIGDNVFREDFSIENIEAQQNVLNLIKKQLNGIKL